jgi:multiple antibiotic resistance protein
MEDFWLCFVPLFVAVDAFGILPLFIGSTEGSDAALRRRIIAQSMLTVTPVTLVFVLAGSPFLRLLGIPVADFMVAGGVLLFALSLSELVAPHRSSPPKAMCWARCRSACRCWRACGADDIDAAGRTGRAAGAARCGVLSWFGGAIYRVVGITGARALQQVTLLLLAAIAVVTVRKGLESFLR